MTAARWPDVYGALLTALPGLPTFTGGPRGDVAVYDGQDVGNDNPVDFVTDDGAGSFVRSFDPSGCAITETGEVRCLLDSNSGDTEPAQNRTRVFEMFSEMETYIVKDQTLGGVLDGCNNLVTLSAQVVSLENGQGAASSLLVSVAYQITTYF